MNVSIRCGGLKWTVGFAICVVMFGLAVSVSFGDDLRDWRKRADESVRLSIKIGNVKAILDTERRMRDELLQKQPDLYCEAVADLSAACERLRGSGPSSAELNSMVLNALRVVRPRVRVSKWSELVLSAAAYAPRWKGKGEEEELSIWKRRRFELAQLILNSIGEVRRAIDPKLDPSVRKNWPGKVQLPDGVDGITGMSPENIADPVLRKQYSDALDRKRRKDAVLKEQFMLRGLDREQTPLLMSAVTYMYKADPRSPNELDGLARTSSLSESEKSSLLSLAKKLRD